MWWGTETRQQEPCESTILEVGPPVSGKPPEDCSLTTDRESQNYAAKLLLDSWLTETV